ncbi:HNH endonuclease [Kitasatospora sp. NBC_01287]|uniref:HNH endonuclease signature motif containing protein n=1 Tax=Kitasatospora sp. NBC_01287 TaxID=2903573 RepID=UPI00225AD9DA|nr:HNH endonuclease signature motif containing protein [Kitasatospora sp. NBC_01287]MCX4743913.1 HNH endonuclease [Kitasatospora sp. NBC_01287]MCX4750990.1 HNH endonuclease [Kitasatospora sp. NBC_01287]
MVYRTVSAFLHAVAEQVSGEIEGERLVVSRGAGGTLSVGRHRRVYQVVEFAAPTEPAWAALLELWERMGLFGPHDAFLIRNERVVRSYGTTKSWGHDPWFGDYEVRDTVRRIRHLQQAITAPLEAILTGAMATPPATSSAQETQALRSAPSIPAQKVVEEPSPAEAQRLGVCPVCEKSGLPPGRLRHLRCERSAKRPEEPVAESGPETGDAEYRRLVAMVEQREEGTRGQRRKGSDRPVRIDAAVRAVLLRCGGLCENPECTGQPDDVTAAGEPILEVDHIDPIGSGGRDHPSNMAALCPNCHAIRTRGRRAVELTGILLAVATAAHRKWLSAE